jgi:diacylglycerol kinase family enzyme
VDGRRLLLAVNANASGVGDPAAAAGRAAHLLRARGAQVETVLTESANELAGLWSRAAGRRVVLLGGDGTLHAAVNAGGERPELALLPAGGANNVATALGIPTALENAAALAVDGSPRHIDLIDVRCGGRRYVAVEGASVGAHAVARERYRARTSTDYAAAVRAGVSAVRRFRGVSIVLETDGVMFGGRIAQLFIANLPLYAFGLHVAPRALPDDGLLDVVVRRWHGRAKLLPLFVRFRLGRAHVSDWRSERVRVDTGRSPLVADATDLGRGVAELDVLRGALAIVAPR